MSHAGRSTELVAIKPRRMAEQKLPNVFAEPGVEDFVRTACTGTNLRAAARGIDIHALECDDDVIAIFAEVADGHRFSMMFNTYTMSGQFRIACPGLILMRDIIDHYAARGLPRPRSRHRLGRLQEAVLQKRRTDLRQLHSAHLARQARGGRDVRDVNRAQARWSSTIRRFSKWRNGLP